MSIRYGRDWKDRDRDVDTPCPEESLRSTASTRTRRSYRELVYFLVATNLILLLSLLIGIFKSNPSPCQSYNNESPIDQLRIRVTSQYFASSRDSSFAGPPSPEIDQAWHELLSKMPLRAADHELAETNQTSVSLPNGGHLVWMGVYHQLHCIKMLRRWVYHDHYHPGALLEDDELLSGHVDHCIDLLRSIVMCHADTTFTTFKWEGQTKPTLIKEQIQRRCVDWNVLMNSVSDRTVDEREIASLKNPFLSDG